MIDAHIHIDFYDRPANVIRDILKYDITAIFVTHLPELYEKQRKLIEGINQVSLGVGFHPILASEYNYNKDLFINALSTTRFVGEVGLDFSISRSPKSRIKQMEIFDTICKYANEHILSVHSRQAEKETLSILRQYKVKNAIFHWYTGEKDLVPEILDAGYYFSINPTMLRSNKGKSILKDLPLNRILIESDGPFTKFEGNIIEPMYMRDIYLAFEEFYEVKNIEELVDRNMFSLLNRCVI